MGKLIEKKNKTKKKALSKGDVCYVDLSEYS